MADPIRGLEGRVIILINVPGASVPGYTLKFGRQGTARGETTLPSRKNLM